MVSHGYIKTAEEGQNEWPGRGPRHVEEAQINSPLTGRTPRGILVSGLRATIHTAVLFSTGEKPGVFARSLLIWTSRQQGRRGWQHKAKIGIGRSGTVHNTGTCSCPHGATSQVVMEENGERSAHLVRDATAIHQIPADGDEQVNRHGDSIRHLTREIGLLRVPHIPNEVGDEPVAAKLHMSAQHK